MILDPARLLAAYMHSLGNPNHPEARRFAQAFAWNEASMAYWRRKEGREYPRSVNEVFVAEYAAMVEGRPVPPRLSPEDELLAMRLRDCFRRVTVLNLLLEKPC